MPESTIVLAILFVVIFLFIPILVSRILRTVDAGTIRLVSWIGGGVSIFKGPGQSWEIPLFTTGTTIPSKAINIDLDIADQTADVDRNGAPRPIKVRVLASAIVSVGDTNETIRTAANRFFSMPMPVQNSTLTDLLTSTGRRAINLLHHDELFNAKVNLSGVNTGSAIVPTSNLQALAAEDDDRLAIIIKSACSRELQDLGLVFNSLNIKEVQSEVADARRRQSAVEAKANADIVQADQERRSREAQLGAEQAVNDKQRDLEQRRAQNAAVIANAEAEKQDALRAQADAEAIRLRTVATAQAEAIRQVNQAIAEGGDAYLSLRQLEMLPQLAPVIANALAQARLVNISSDGRGAAAGATDQITGVIQTILAAQLVQTSLKDTASPNGLPAQTPAAQVPAPAPIPAPAPQPVLRTTVRKAD